MSPFEGESKLAKPVERVMVDRYGPCATRMEILFSQVSDTDTREDRVSEAIKFFKCAETDGEDFLEFPRPVIDYMWAAIRDGLNVEESVKELKVVQDLLAPNE